jgi:hypothetical protein
MKKKIALILVIIMMFMTTVPTFAINKAMIDTMVDKIAQYDSQTRSSLFANIAVFSGAEDNLEMVCSQIDAQNGMVYDMIKPVINEFGADATKAMLRSIASFGCPNMKNVFYALADAKTKPKPLTLSIKAKAGMTALFTMLDQSSPELAAILREDGVNESVLAYVLKNMFLNVGDGYLFKYNETNSVFSVNAISQSFKDSLDRVWADIELGGESLTADTLVRTMVDAFNGYLDAKNSNKVADALKELGLCEFVGESESDGGNSNAGGGTVVDKPNDENEETPPAVDDKKQFTDIDNYAWAKDAIYELRDKGIINGTSETTFAPANNIKRGDFILILTRMLGITGGADNFVDVPSGSYYYNAISAAKAAGIAKGTDGNFVPEASITRQDLITLAYRAFCEKGYISAADDMSVLDTFSDGTLISGYAKEAMAAMVNRGIIKGSDGGVNPVGYATRAEVAVMCSRLIALMK